MTQTAVSVSGRDATPVNKPAIVAALVALTVLAKAPLYAQYTPNGSAPTETLWPSVAVDTNAVASPTAPSGARLRALILGGDVDYGRGRPNGPSANADATPPPVFRALFCRFDDDLDAKKIPLRLRAGDLETVNKLERKPGW